MLALGQENKKKQGRNEKERERWYLGLLKFWTTKKNLAADFV
jgi:hypothetical protein